MRRGACRTTASGRSSPRASPTSSTRTARKIGLLPVVLPEEQCTALAAAGEAEIDLEDLVVRAGGQAYPFEIDPEIRHRLLNGLDDIAMTLQSAVEIELYESERERTGPVTTSL